MERLRTRRFRLRPKAGQENPMRCFPGFAVSSGTEHLRWRGKAVRTVRWKTHGIFLVAQPSPGLGKKKETSVLSEVHSRRISQQALKASGRVYKNFFAKRADFFAVMDVPLGPEFHGGANAVPENGCECSWHPDGLCRRAGFVESNPVRTRGRRWSGDSQTSVRTQCGCSGRSSGPSLSFNRKVRWKRGLQNSHS